MTDKDVLDYVRDQRTLRVKDSSIKKSLLDVGYSVQEADEALRKAPAYNPVSSGPGMFSGLDISNQMVITLMVVIAIGIVLLVLYSTKSQNDRMDSAFQSIDQRISALNSSLTVQQQKDEEISSSITATQTALSTLRTTLESTDDSFKTDLQEYRYDSLRRDSTLSTSVQEISNKSSSELSDLQKEFKEIKSSTADFSKIIPKATAAVVLIGEKNDNYGVFTAVGSGVFINKAGYIVTNEHVVDEINRITVKTSTGSEYTATVIEEDAKMDVALIKLDTDLSIFTYLEWADSDKVIVGQQVIAIGSPIGYQSTVTQGIISNTQRVIAGSDLYYFQTDVAINKGNSGGPLIDKDGNIVGIASKKFMESGYEGLSFALRANDVKNRVSQMMYANVG